MVGTAHIGYDGSLAVFKNKAAGNFELPATLERDSLCDGQTCPPDCRRYELVSIFSVP